MFRQYKFRNYNFRLIVFVIALSIIGYFAVGSAKEAYEQKQIETIKKKSIQLSLGRFLFRVCKIM